MTSVVGSSKAHEVAAAAPGARNQEVLVETPTEGLPKGAEAKPAPAARVHKLLLSREMKENLRNFKQKVLFASLQLRFYTDPPDWDAKLPRSFILKLARRCHVLNEAGSDYFTAVDLEDYVTSVLTREEIRSKTESVMNKIFRGLTDYRLEESTKKLFRHGKAGLLMIRPASRFVKRIESMAAHDLAALRTKLDVKTPSVVKSGELDLDRLSF